MKIEEAKQRLKGKRVNIWNDPIAHRGFLGAARVTSVLSVNELENTVFAKVKFHETGRSEKRTIYLGGR